MKIGILGSGDVAKTLGAGFLSRGHEVMLGTRDAAKLSDWQKAHANARVGTFAQAAGFGELNVLATLGTAVLAALQLAPAENFDGKVVIDATNPLRFDDQKPHLAMGFEDSLGEEVQRALPRARVVKAFNTVGSALMVDPKLAGGPPSMFLAGNDDGAKAAVSEILRDFGWEPIDLGGIESSRYLEPMCLAWVTYGLRSGTWNHAFKLLH